MTNAAVWNAVKLEARQATKEFFAPFVGAVRGAVVATQRAEREGRLQRFRVSGKKMVSVTAKPQKKGSKLKGK